MVSRDEPLERLLQSVEFALPHLALRGGAHGLHRARALGVLRPEHGHALGRQLAQRRAQQVAELGDRAGGGLIINNL
jgi:hypothetical protein